MWHLCHLLGEFMAQVERYRRYTLFISIFISTSLIYGHVKERKKETQFSSNPCCEEN